MKNKADQKRPGGRTAEVTRRINGAVQQLLAEQGLDACTIKAIAERAGVQRSTLYRRSADRWPIIMEAVIDLASRETAKFDSGSFCADMRIAMLNLARILNGPLGPPLMEIAGALQSGVAPGESERFWESRRKLIAPMFDGAIARGELPANIDRDAVFAMAAGPLYFQRFIRGAPIDPDWVERLVVQVCGLFVRPVSRA
ncbi:TetR/AcrR family transcriptional regulator [Sphingomonas xanthus]|uniref:TetR/AcrR family transcriptional regulator n=1 Tax=Sphingomonas xanthus TaxID=2594473 RepID=UPI00164D3E4A|nr:TetR/AcrR family transcriptional regulator [Sphingomonas xanthus]